MSPKIIYIDDDIHPVGRISQRILPIFEEKGLIDVVLHFKTFEQFKLYILNVENESEIVLIILDSSLDLGERLYQMTDTLPYIVSRLEDIASKGNNNRLAARESLISLCQRIMPASGRSKNTSEEILRQRDNNNYFREYMQRIDIPINEDQMDLARIGGSTGEPKEVVTTILKYYSLLYPNEVLEQKKEILNEMTYRNNNEVNNETLIADSRILSSEERRPFTSLRNKLLDELGVPELKDDIEVSKR